MRLVPRLLLFFQGRRWRATYASRGIPLAPDELMVRDGGRHPDDAQVGVSAVVFARLTPRQRLVSVWMTAGFSTGEICEHLGLTRREIDAEIDAIRRAFRGRRS